MSKDLEEVGRWHHGCLQKYTWAMRSASAKAKTRMWLGLLEESRGPVWVEGGALGQK